MLMNRVLLWDRYNALQIGKLARSPQKEYPGQDGVTYPGIRLFLIRYYIVCTRDRPRKRWKWNKV